MLNYICRLKNYLFYAPVKTKLFPYTHLSASKKNKKVAHTRICQLVKM